MAATLPDLADPAEAARSAMRGHRASAATNRAGKSGASHRVSAKIALWRVETLVRIPRYALRISPTIKRFLRETPPLCSTHTLEKIIGALALCCLVTVLAPQKATSAPTIIVSHESVVSAPRTVERIAVNNFPVEIEPFFVRHNGFGFLIRQGALHLSDARPFGPWVDDNLGPGAFSFYWRKRSINGGATNIKLMIGDYIVGGSLPRIFEYGSYARFIVGSWYMNHLLMVYHDMDVGAQLTPTSTFHYAKCGKQSGDLEDCGGARNGGDFIAEIPPAEPTIAPLFWSIGCVCGGFLLCLLGGKYFNDEGRLFGATLGCFGFILSVLGFLIWWPTNSLLWRLTWGLFF